MIIILSRLFFRLAILFIAVFSVFYFYILEYKYDPNIGFIKTSWTYSLENIDNGYIENVVINWKKYNLSENKIILHNIFDQKTCWELKIWDYNDYLCYKNNDNHIVYISKNSVKLVAVKNTIYNNLILKKSYNPFIKYSFKWKEIYFDYYKNGDIVYKDDISSKKLINIKNLEFVGYNTKWLFVIKDNDLYFMKLSN